MAQDGTIVSPQPETEPSWQIKLLYDGECPLCLREVNFLSARDGGRGRVAFVDIAAEDYDPDENGGVDFEAAMGRIHGVLPNGSVVKNVEVFRRAYSALGMGWIYAATRWPLVRPIVDKIYEFWAERRLALTGRPDLNTIVAKRQMANDCSNSQESEEQRCRLPKA
ncbi:MAG: DUF393 domain-containing protein [Elainellaceae cyanobacterium]